MWKCREGRKVAAVRAWCFSSTFPCEGQKEAWERQARCAAECNGRYSPRTSGVQRRWGGRTLPLGQCVRVCKWKPCPGFHVSFPSSVVFSPIAPLQFWHVFISCSEFEFSKLTLILFAWFLVLYRLFVGDLQKFLK